MKLIITVFIMLYSLVSVTPPVYAEEPPPVIRGEGAYLIDVMSGQALFMKNPNTQLAPASTTKIMTALLAIEKGNFSDIVTVSSTMLNNKLVYGTAIYLEPGEKIGFEDLIYATLLNSANDAAVTLAEHIGGGDIPSFVEMMNQKALDIGATQTHFVNPSGLTEEGHVTTAHDLALIARAAYRNPMFAEYVRTKTHPISRSKENVPILMVNQNELLWKDPSINGIKLGYTQAAQNCFVASASKDGRQLIGVILKSPGKEIWTDMQVMFNYGFSQYESTVFKSRGSVISSIIVNNEPVDLILDDPIYMTQKLNEPQASLNLRVTQDTNPLTSVEKGQVVGHVEILEGETLLNTLPLKTSRGVEEKSGIDSVGSSHLAWIIGSILTISFIALMVNSYQRRRRTRYWRRQVRRSTRRRNLSGNFDSHESRLK